MDDILKKFYEKGYKSPNKLFYKIKEKGYDIRKTDAKKYVDSRKIKSRVKRFNKSFMGNKFSAILDTWQIDTYITEKYKTKYLLAINVNTRYVWCGLRNNLDSNDFIENIKKFIQEFNPRIIECDEEKSFISFKSINYLKSRNVIVKVYPSDMNHEQLSTINSFCRTLRIESRNIDSDPDIPRIVKVYNKSYHSSIKMAPRDMQFNRNLELKYIYDQLAIRDDKNKLLLKDPINKGDKVRYIRDEDRKEKKFQKDKMKYQLSKYFYIVERKNSEFSFDIIANDGSIKNVPRYRLFKLTPTEENIMKYAPTIEDKNNFQIFDEIIDYIPKFKKNGDLNENTTKYIVRIISRDKNGKKIPNRYEYTIYQLRSGMPTSLSDIEYEFYLKNKDKYKIDKTTSYLLPK